MIGNAVVAVIAIPFGIFFLFMAGYVFITPTAWTVQTCVLVAIACCIAAASCLHVAYRFLRAGAPQRIASPFLLLFSAVVVFFGLAMALTGITERDIDEVCGALVFLALGTAGVWQTVRGQVGGRDADDAPAAPDFPPPGVTPHAHDLDAAQRARRTAILVTWCMLALSIYISLFTQLPHVVAVLAFFASAAPYVASIRVIEPWLLRRSGTSSR